MTKNERKDVSKNEATKSGARRGVAVKTGLKAGYQEPYIDGRGR